MKTKTTSFLIAAISFFTASFSIPSRKVEDGQLKDFHINGYAQGTTYHITYYAADSIIRQPEIDLLLDNIDSSLSLYKSYSLINRFNNTDVKIAMDKHLSIVVKRSLEIFRETGGISDITVYPLVKAWGFGVKPVTDLPDSNEIRGVMPCVGAQKLHINGRYLIKDTPCVKIDLNGIGQGYSVDVVARYLESKGVRNYMVEIGGELRVKGRKQPGGELMKIGIEAPPENSFSDPVVQKIISVAGGAVTTSGNYRKYVQMGKIKVSHLMDPHTGYPIQNELISVTVKAGDAITADGYDNALMGMGLKNAFLFLKKHREMEAYFIYHKPDGSVADTATAGFNRIH